MTFRQAASNAISALAISESGELVLIIGCALTMQLNTFPPIVVQDQFSFTLNFSDWNWREGSAVIDADGCDNRNIQIKEIGQPTSVSSPYNSFGYIVATFTNAFRAKGPPTSGDLGIIPSSNEKANKSNPKFEASCLPFIFEPFFPVIEVLLG